MTHGRRTGWLLGVLSCAALLAGCHQQRTESSSAASTSATDELQRVSGAGYRGYIVAADAAEGWTPSSAEIRELEARLEAARPVFVQDGRSLGTLDLTRYTRQYRGQSAEGRRVIEVRFFCETHRHLAAAHSLASGGGACFLNARYEVPARRFSSFRANSGR